MTEYPKLDPLSIGVEVVFRKEKAIIRRMLSVWNPEWGIPLVVRRPAYSTDFTVKPFCVKINNNLVGLCADSPPLPVIRVWAHDQLDADGNVLPWPQQDDSRSESK